MKRCFVLLIVMFLACKENSNVSTCFQFDRVEHYYLNISDDTLSSINWDENKTLDSFLINDFPYDMSDTVMLKSLEQCGYTKRILPEENKDKILKVFCDKKSYEPDEVTACSPIYRDILVLKSEAKIVGVAKLCFDCGDSFIISNDLNEPDYGKRLHFGRLYQALH